MHSFDVRRISYSRAPWLVTVCACEGYALVRCTKNIILARIMVSDIFRRQKKFFIGTKVKGMVYEKTFF